MAKAFGFTDDELKLLLVAVRQMRRTFTQAAQARAQGRKVGLEPDSESGLSFEEYARLYDGLFEKLIDMVGRPPGDGAVPRTPSGG